MGAGIGFLTVAAYTLYDMSDEEADWKGYFNAPVLFGSIGAIIGSLIGAALSKDKTIQIEGKSESEIKETFEYLRKKVRIPDYN